MRRLIATIVCSLLGGCTWVGMGVGAGTGGYLGYQDPGEDFSRREAAAIGALIGAAAGALLGSYLEDSGSTGSSNEDSSSSTYSSEYDDDSDDDDGYASDSGSSSADTGRAETCGGKPKPSNRRGLCCNVSYAEPGDPGYHPPYWYDCSKAKIVH